MLKHGIYKVGGYVFPHSCDGPRNSRPFLSGALVDIKFDISAADSDISCEYRNILIAIRM
jgi:hypothetical protein